MDNLEMKEIENFPGYFITKEGKVYSKKSGKYIKQQERNIAPKVSLTNETMRCNSLPVHVLVAKTYIDNPENLPYVTHIDGDRFNNNVENLKWCTHKKSVEDAIKNNRTNPQYKSVRQYKITETYGDVIIFNSLTGAAKDTEVTEGAITLACQLNRKTAGYKWRYKDPNKNSNPKPIIRTKILREKVFVKEYPSINDAAKELGTCNARISAACTGHKKSAVGYIWEFVNKPEPKVEEETTKDWKVIPGFSKYKISKEGEVCSINRKKLLKKRINSSGYYEITLTGDDGRRISARHHIILAKTFIPNPRNKKTVNHIDGNKLNNNLKNLEWSTHKEQVEHAVKIGLVKTCKPIIQLSLDGKELKTFSSVSEAARNVNASPSNISGVCNGRLISCKDYKWKYA